MRPGTCARRRTRSPDSADTRSTSAGIGWQTRSIAHDAELPPDFLAGLARLAESYLASSDPRLQSGFGGGVARWRAEREPILDAVERNGSLLDVGCANGFLLECLRTWGIERGLTLEPFGVDASEALVALARRRLPRFASNFHVGNAWSWSPPRRFTTVYSLADVVPLTHLAPFLARVRAEFLEPGGRLIVGSYGSLSRRLPALDLERLLPSFGLTVAGSVRAGTDGVACFVWC